MDHSKWKTERRGSFVVLTLTIIIILVIVIAAICVSLLLEGELQKIILMVLLALLILIGLASFMFFEYQRKEAVKKRDRSAELWLQQTLEEQRRVTRPTPALNNAYTSWALTTPWRHSDEHKMIANDTLSSTLPPYSPPHSDIY